MRNKNKHYLLEAQKISYAKRSLFFLKKLREGNFQKLAKEVATFSPKNYGWSPLEKFGITSSAWDHITQRKIPSSQIFCHPQVIIQSPKLIAYYRGIACISLKGLQQLAFSTSSLERYPKAKIKADKASILSKVLNELISSLIDNDKDFVQNDAIMLLFATAGAEIDGSWKNIIGKKAAINVKDMIANYFFENNLIEKIIIGSKEVEPTKESIKRRIRGFIAKNNVRIIFESEPDVSVYKKDKLIGIIEIKGGLDPGGALERYGAAQKTFKKALRRNPKALTMYLASCITHTVKEEIDSDQIVSEIVDLTNVLFNEEDRINFLKKIHWWTEKIVT